MARTPTELLEVAARGKLSPSQEIVAAAKEEELDALLVRDWSGGSITVALDCEEAVMNALIRRFEKAGWLAMTQPQFSQLAGAAGPTPIPGRWLLNLRPRWWMET